MVFRVIRKLGSLPARGYSLCCLTEVWKKLFRPHKMRLMDSIPDVRGLHLVSRWCETFLLWRDEVCRLLPFGSLAGNYAAADFCTGRLDASGSSSVSDLLEKAIKYKNRFDYIFRQPLFFFLKHCSSFPLKINYMVQKTQMILIISCFIVMPIWLCMMQRREIEMSSFLPLSDGLIELMIMNLCACVCL